MDRRRTYLHNKDALHVTCFKCNYEYERSNNYNHESIIRTLPLTCPIPVWVALFINIVIYKNINII